MVRVFVARQGRVLVGLLGFGEDLEDPARRGIGLLRREPPQAQLRVGRTALSHEANQDARKRDLGRGVELRERLACRFLLGSLLRLALAAPELLAIDDGCTGEVPLVRRPLDGDLHVRHVPAAAGE